MPMCFYHLNIILENFIYLFKWICLINLYDHIYILRNLYNTYFCINSYKWNLHIYKHFSSFSGFFPIAHARNCCTIHLLTDNVKKYIWHSIFSLILVFMNCFNFCKLNEWKIFLFYFNISFKNCFWLWTFFECSLVIFVSYTLPIFLFFYSSFLADF